MIHELRTYTLAPGTQGKYLELNRDIGRKVRGDRFGKLEGAWTTEIGPLNRYVHLWSYPDLNERDRLRKALGAEPGWKDYVGQIQPLILEQENKILVAADGLPFAPPIGGDRHIYELRTYRTRTGKAPEWLGHFREIMPTREKYSKNVGVWSTDVAQLNQVVHLWAYSDLNHRADVRGKVMQDPQWKVFLGKATPLLVDMQSMVMTPTDASPIK
jgi:NIPSNAP